MAQVEVLINENGTLACVIRKWYPVESANGLCEKLKHEVKWRQEPVKIMGKSIMQPRQIYACGEEGLQYKYSGLQLNVEPWIPEVQAIKDQIEAHLPALFALLQIPVQESVKFNSCLLNE